MKRIFIIYCIWYILLAFLMKYGEFDSLFISRSLGAIAILNTGFIVLFPIAVIINPSIIKSNRTDQKYMNYCFAAGLFRIIFWAVSIYGLRDHTILLSLNASGILLYALIIEKHTKRISNEYFKY